MSQLQLDTKIKFNYFCNISHSFFLKQIYYQIPVKGELWNSIVVFFYKLQFSFVNLCLASEGVRLCCSWYYVHDSKFLVFVFSTDIDVSSYNVFMP